MLHVMASVPPFTPFFPLTLLSFISLLFSSLSLSFFFPLYFPQPFSTPLYPIFTLLSFIFFLFSSLSLSFFFPLYFLQPFSTPLHPIFPPCSTVLYFSSFFFPFPFIFLPLVFSSALHYPIFFPYPYPFLFSLFFFTLSLFPFFPLFSFPFSPFCPLFSSPFIFFPSHHSPPPEGLVFSEIYRYPCKILIDPDPFSLKRGSGSSLNSTGSETLQKRHIIYK